MMRTLREWEEVFEKEIASDASGDDPAHDLLHFRRVVATSKRLCAAENGNLHIVVPAAWLHDFVIVPKNSPLRSSASKLSAEKALSFLKNIGYPKEFIDHIAHAIEGHSFSANIEVKTLEAKIVQDADRLDGLGAIGIARCFATAGLLRRSFYRPEDSFCESRVPDDEIYTVDHFYKKLFNTAKTLKTKSGQEEGQKRLQVMHEFLNRLQTEIE